MSPVRGPRTGIGRPEAVRRRPAASLLLLAPAVAACGGDDVPLLAGDVTVDRGSDG